MLRQSLELVGFPISSWHWLLTTASVLFVLTTSRSNQLVNKQRNKKNEFNLPHHVAFLPSVCLIQRPMVKLQMKFFFVSFGRRIKENDALSAFIFSFSLRLFKFTGKKRTSVFLFPKRLKPRLLGCASPSSAPVASSLLRSLLKGKKKKYFFFK